MKIMDKENISVKIEPELYVVVKEELVDLAEESGYDSVLSSESEQLTDVLAKCPKGDGLDMQDSHVKSSYIISKGVNSHLDVEYNIDKNILREVKNPITKFPHPVLPPFTLPYIGQTMPWGMYAPSPYLPFPYYQLPMIPFSIQSLSPLLGQLHHPDNMIPSTLLQPLEDNTNTTVQVLKSNPTHDNIPLPSGKVKKSPKARSTPYNRAVSNKGQVDSPILNVNHTENMAHSKTVEQPNMNANQASDTGFIDVDGLDNVSAYKPIFDPERPFKCTECGRGFAKKYYLSVHMRLHTGEKSYKCSQCPKAFRQRNSLVIHQRNHSDDRPFECSLCDRRFTNKSDIKRHFVSHIPEKTGEINYKKHRRS